MNRKTAAHDKAYHQAGLSAKELIIPAVAGAALGVLSGFLDGVSWLEWVFIGLAALCLIGVAVFLAVLMRRTKPQKAAPRKAAPEKAAPYKAVHDEEANTDERPYVIRDPLFEKIKEQYAADGLSDFINYVSLRGWKLIYVDEEEDSVEFIFLRGGRQVMVSLFDGFAEAAVELGPENGRKLKFDYGGFSEPVELWNAMINAVKSSARAGS